FPQLLLTKEIGGFHASMGWAKPCVVNQQGVMELVGDKLNKVSEAKDTSAKRLVMDFVEKYMNRHPVYQKAVQEAVNKVVSKPAPTSPWPPLSSKVDTLGGYQ
ncbi:MAG TPA: hypothetical protein VIF12_08110, partial [Micavibrio sp.]